LDARATLLADFDHEMAVTRHLIERVPEASFDWRPHERSFSLGELATHLATLPRWGLQILTSAFHDMASAKGQRASLPTVAAVLDLFDRQVSDVRRALIERSTAELAATWALRHGRETLLTVPKDAAFRRFLLHHVIHHRGQLTVYLRLLDVPLPPIYGPSADEKL
jgi:uncharacterized damage-inducible protein DinB